MALNMDDLIGSMQHGFHAGDRGNDLNEIRDQLKMSLPQQHPSTSTSAAGPSQYQPHSRRNLYPSYQHGPGQGGQGGSSLDADVAMLSSSQQYGWGQPQAGQFFGGPGSWGSQSSSSSNVSGAFATGFAAAPANTPQQTPVETSALARQLQAELERQSQSDNAGAQGLSPQLGSPSQQQFSAETGRGEAIGSPRNYVNGFSPHNTTGPGGAREAGGAERGSATPTAQPSGFGFGGNADRSSLSPPPGANGGGNRLG